MARDTNREGEKKIGEKRRWILGVKSRKREEWVDAGKKKK